MWFHGIALRNVVICLLGGCVLFTGCGKPKESDAPIIGPAPAQPPAGAPVILISQTSEYPRPGQFPQYRRGLVAALWSDGHMVRCASKEEIGKTYTLGTVSEKERNEFLAYLKTDEVMKAPKVAHMRLHAATLQVTINGEGGRQKWVCELPDDSSVWVKLEERMLSLPMPDAKSADEAKVREAEKEE